MVTVLLHCFTLFLALLFPVYSYITLLESITRQRDIILVVSYIAPFISDSSPSCGKPQAREVRAHPIQFKYDDHHSVYAECVVDVRDTRRVELAVWWLQVVGARSLSLEGAECLSPDDIQRTLCALLTEKSFAPAGSPLPFVLEELTCRNNDNFNDEGRLFSALKCCQRLRKLPMEHYHLSSLNGIDKLTGLEVLQMNCAGVSTLDPVARCTRLHTVHLGDRSKLTCFKPLGKLKYLTCLSGERMWLMDFTELRECAALRRLGVPLSSTLSLLKGAELMPLLTHLDLSYSIVTDLTPLSGCRHLQNICLNSATELDSLEGLQKVATLTTLDLSYTKVKCLRPLQDLPLLHTLCLIQCTNIHSLEGLERMTQLTDLNLSYTKVCDLHPLQNNTRLRKLVLKNTPVDSLDALKRMTKLTHLDLSRSRVRSLKALRDCTQMRQLSADFCPIPSLEGLEKMADLTDLDLTDTQVEGLSALRVCKRMERIVLSGLCQVRLLDVIKDMVSLKELSLASTEVCDLRPLKNCVQLESLDLQHCYVLRSLVGVERLPKLQRIYWSAYAKGADFSAIPEERRDIIIYA